MSNKSRFQAYLGARKREKEKEERERVERAEREEEEERKADKEVVTGKN